MRRRGRARRSRENEKRAWGKGESVGEETFTLSSGSPFRMKLNYLVPYSIKHAFRWTSDEIFEMSPNGRGATDIL